MQHTTWRAAYQIHQTLMRLRMRWLTHCTANAMLRRGQALVMCALIIGPGVAFLVMQLAVPLFMPLSSTHSLAARLGAVLGLQAVGLLWVIALQTLIRGDGFMQFARTLPLSRRAHRLSDAAMLLAVDAPLLLLAGLSVFFHARNGGPFGPLHIAYLLVFAALMLLAQFAVLDRRVRLAFVVVLADVLLSSVLAGGWLAASFVMLALVFVSVIMAFLWPQVPPITAPIPLPAKATNLPHSPPRLSPRLALSLTILLRQRSSELIGRASLCAAIIVSAIAMMALWEYDYRAPYLLVIVLTLTAGVVSGLYRSLHMAHVAAAQFTAALPLARTWWRWFDLALVLCFGLLFALSFIFWVFMHGGVTPRVAALTAVFFAALLLALRWPQIHAEHHSVAIASVVAGSAMALTFYFL